MPGVLENLKILAFTDAAYTRPAVVPAFPVLINPESFTRRVRINYDTRRGPGGTEQEARFTSKAAEQFNCDLVFDATGIADGLPRASVDPDVEAFRAFLLGIEQETHEMRHFQLIWGTMIFRGRLRSLQFEYKLFNANGTPIRAIAKAAFIGSYASLLQMALDKLLSPDLTQAHTVVAGDTLPNLCQHYYGSAERTVEVARFNRLSSFRQLTVGDSLYFPPLKKDRS